MDIYAYYNTDTQEYPVFAGEMYKLFPELDPQEELVTPPAPYVPVNNIYDEIPQIQSYAQKIVEDAPIYDEVSGLWKRTFTIVDLTSEEQNAALVFTMNKVRAERDAKLLESDAMVTVDRWETYSEEIKEELRTYRQELRDLPEQEGFPYSMIFPEIPII